MRKLNVSQRAFCRLVAQASIANHFGDQRFHLDQAISEQSSPPSRHDLFHEAADRVRRFVAELEARKAERLELYEGEDRQLLELTLLFDIFHRLMEPFDAHILRQMASPDLALKVTFADHALQLLQRYGFSQDLSLRHFCLFFQLRRAFYFIDQQLTGTSPCMLALKQHLWDTLFTHNLGYYRDHLLERMEDFSIMLLGETGTGKGAAAAALSRSGYIPFRPDTGIFVASFAARVLAINLSQFPPGLMESEVFGHEKGAFTGAVYKHEGVLARCNAYGAIFLDEIGEVSTSIQIKLLDVLQTRTFTPVGSHTQRRFSGRIIAASNRDLEALRREGVFRDDFYYRLCSDEIVVPPLRQRIREDPNELRNLIRHRLVAIVGRDEPAKADELHRNILDQLGLDYSWPGNVRELEQCIRRMLLRQEYRTARVSAPDHGGDTWARRMEEGQLTVAELNAEYCRFLHQKLGTLDKVARATGLDWRTVKKYLK